MNKSNKMINVLSILHDITNTLSMATVLSIFYMYLSEILDARHPVSSPVGIIFILITSLIDYACRKKCANLVLFTILHGLMAPVALLLPIPLVEKIIMTGYLVLLFCFAYKFWTSEDTTTTICSTEIPVEILVLTVPMYIHSAYFLSESVTLYILWASIIFLGLYFLSIFLNRLLIFVLSIPAGSVVPLSGIIRINSISIIIVIIVGFVLISSIITLTTEGNGIMILLKKMVPLLGAMLTSCVSCMGTGKSDDIEEETTTRVTHDMVENVAPYLKENKWMVLISDILKIVVLFAFIVFVIYVIIQFFKMYMHKGSKDIDIIEKTDGKYSEQKTKTVRTRSIFKPRNNNDKVRRIYRKKMLSYNGTIIEIRDTDSPQTINRKIKNKISEDNTELTSLYEEARYGKDIVSDKTISRVKELTGKKSKH